MTRVYLHVFQADGRSKVFSFAFLIKVPILILPEARNARGEIGEQHEFTEKTIGCQMEIHQKIYNNI